MGCRPSRVSLDRELRVVKLRHVTGLSPWPRAGGKDRRHRRLQPLHVPYDQPLCSRTRFRPRPRLRRRRAGRRPHPIPHFAGSPVSHQSARRRHAVVRAPWQAGHSQRVLHAWRYGRIRRSRTSVDDRPPAVGAAFADAPLDAVLCSHLVRASETARHIAAPHGLEPVVYPELREVETYRDVPDGVRLEDILPPVMWHGVAERFVQERRWDVSPFL